MNASQKARLAKLEKQVPPRDDQANLYLLLWEQFYKRFLAAIASYPQVADLVRDRVKANSVALKQPTVSDKTLWLMTNTCWYALREEGPPEAMAAAEAAIKQLEQEILELQGGNPEPDREQSEGKAADR